MPDSNAMLFSSSYDMCGHRSAFFRKTWRWYCKAAKNWKSLGTGDEALMTSTVHGSTTCKKMEEKLANKKAKRQTKQNEQRREQKN